MKRHTSGTFADADLSPINPVPIFCIVMLILIITFVSMLSK